MDQSNPRREFIKRSALATAGALGASALGAQGAKAQDGPLLRAEDPAAHPSAGADVHESNVRDAAAPREVYDGFSRLRPSRGDDPQGDYYLGKLVPGLRYPADGPAPFVAPDLEKLPFVLKNGVKEFHLVPQPVRREFLPGYWMNVYGYNGSMPGPTIEVNQGDRMRIVVTNELPEDTFVHCHGFELPVQYDGSDVLAQNPIRPGQDVRLRIRRARRRHVLLSLARADAGSVRHGGLDHRAPAESSVQPPVDRDFGLIFQNFFIDSTQTIADSWRMDWNWHTINGRSGPFTTPLVVKHGERVRVRIMNFSPMQHHPDPLARAHLLDHRARRGSLPAVGLGAAQHRTDRHCAGDRLRVHRQQPRRLDVSLPHGAPHDEPHGAPGRAADAPGDSVDRYLANLDVRPAPEVSPTALAEKPPGYPQEMLGMHMTPEFMHKIWSSREVQGMRADWPMSVMGLMTTLRVLPDDLYRRVMETDEAIPKGSVFEEIVRRFGDIKTYQPPPGHMMMH